MLIVYLMRRVKKTSFLYRKLNGLKKIALKLKVLLMLFTVSLTYGFNTGPINYMTYNVVRNNVVIGTIKINSTTNNGSVTYSLNSNIVAKYLLKFNISGKETSIFENGVLVYSSVYRKLNNKVKTNHTITYKEGRYQLDNSPEGKHLNFAKIQNNLVTLYFNEPKGLNSVFCDNLKQMVKLQSLGDGRYKVFFSKGKYNIFYYEGGKCVKIEANSALFSVTLIPALS